MNAHEKLAAVREVVGVETTEELIRRCAELRAKVAELEAENERLKVDDRQWRATLARTDRGVIEMTEYQKRLETERDELRADSADAASLRRAFDRAIATYPQHLAKFISKEAEAAFRAWWGQFYEAVRDHTAGLKLLLASVAAPPAGTYSCGCAAQWAERKIDGFCAVHYKPLKTT